MFICFTPQNKHFFQTLVGPRIAILLHLSFNRPFPEEEACGEVGPSIALYYISLLSGLGNIDDQNRDHLIGRPTMSWADN